MNALGAPDPADLEATVQAALGTRCSVGIDFVDIEEVARSIEALGDAYLDRLFTAHERASCIGSPRARAASFAARFAAKEAALKVLAPTGPRPEWRSIEVVRLPHGACELHLHGTAAALADAAGLRGFSVSLTHEGGLAAAVVVAERSAEAPSITRLERRDDHNGPPESGGTDGPRHRDPSPRQGDR
jgi:holo-[acyl-carrier protein] synthase